MRVLVTGAAGSIGTILLPGLTARGHEVIGLDRSTAPDGSDTAWYAVDCTDPDAVEAVFVDLARSGGIEAVVHLAGIPTEASLTEELDSHVVSTAALLDAMVRHGVDRIVYASSNHAVGRTPRTDLLTTDVRPRPDTFYGVPRSPPRRCSACTSTGTASTRWRCASGRSCRSPRPGVACPPGSPTTTPSGWSTPR